MKRSIVSALILFALTAVAESTFVQATGQASSSDKTEATGNAIDQAEVNLNNMCDGHLRNIQTSVSCFRSGSSQFGYTYYCTATKNAQCEKSDDQ
jgi:hypothetical protein